MSGTRLLYQQSAELLAKAVAAQTVLPGTKSCSQTTPPHRTMPHGCPTARQTTWQREYIARAEFLHTMARLIRNTGFIMGYNTPMLRSPDKPPDK